MQDGTVNLPKGGRTKTECFPWEPRGDVPFGTLTVPRCDGLR
jgi:hypothetical protein